MPNTLRQPPNPVLEARVARLRDQEFDWQITIQDLTEEIQTRTDQLVAATRQLRATRHELRQVLQTIACDGAAA